MKLVLLEDDERRTEAMLQSLEKNYPKYGCFVFDSSAGIIDFLKTNLSSTILISLDHDLPLFFEDDGSVRDLGNGQEVADYLAAQTPTCSVIIHSTNYPASQSMQLSLEESGWETFRVSPYDDLDWIHSAWSPIVRKILQNL